MMTSCPLVYIFFSLSTALVKWTCLCGHLLGILSPQRDMHSSQGWAQGKHVESSMIKLPSLSIDNKLLLEGIWSSVRSSVWGRRPLMSFLILALAATDMQTFLGGDSLLSTHLGLLWAPAAGSSALLALSGLGHGGWMLALGGDESSNVGEEPMVLKGLWLPNIVTLSWSSPSSWRQRQVPVLRSSAWGTALTRSPGMERSSLGLWPLLLLACWPLPPGECVLLCEGLGVRDTGL